MAKKTISVNSVYTQTKAVEKDGKMLFNYVGEDFVVEKYEYGIVRCRGVNGDMRNCIFGIEDTAFFNFFDAQKQKELSLKDYFLRIMKM